MQYTGTGLIPNYYKYDDEYVRIYYTDTYLIAKYYKYKQCVIATLSKRHANVADLGTSRNTYNSTSKETT